MDLCQCEEKKTPTDPMPMGVTTSNVAFRRVKKRYQLIIYHKQRGYKNKKARLMPRSFFEK